MSDRARARALSEVGRHQDALPFAQRVVAAAPGDPSAHCQLALVLYHLERHGEALAASDRAAALGPEDDWPHRLRALALLGLKRRRAALQAAREAVRLAPDVPEAHHVLVQALLANHRRKDAAESARRCLELAPGSILGHNASALVLLSAKKWREAEDACRRALAIDPEDPAARHNLGLAVSMQKGRALEGVRHLTEASKLDPADKRSREQAVAAGRRYALGGFLFLYVLLQLLRAGVRSWEDDSALAAMALLAAFVAGSAFVLLRRRRRLARLPAGVAELIRTEGRRRLSRVAFWLALVVGALALVGLAVGLTRA